ncbi:hypothetical protein ABPG72_015983 [Tetrahymena utriculariae]
MAEQKNQNKKKVKPISKTNYVIDFRGDPLAKGAYGQIRRVYDLENTQKKLCCKIISIQKFKHLQLALNELKVIEQLPQNINLVNFEKIKFNTQEDMYFIMEYCEGGNLQHYIQENDYLSEQEIKDFLYQFVQGYTDLHSYSILHRDLKPENILIHKNLYKIADFGLSKVLEFKNQNVESFGTLQYMAPELYPQYLRDKMFNAVTDYSKIDMFSLGVILYNLAYKEKCHPYVGTIKQLLGNNFQQDEIKLLCKSVNAQKEIVILPYPCRSEQLLNLIKKLCEKDVNQRMSFDELIQCDYIYDQPKQQIDTGSNLFNSYIQNENQSILKLIQRQSFRQTIYPQPGVSFESKIFGEMNLQDNFNYSDIKKISKSKILIDDDDDDEDISKTQKEIMNEIQEQELQKQLDQIEEDNRRKDEQYQEIFAIFDKCLYLRQIIFFFDKVQLHLDSFIKMIYKKIKPVKKIKNSVFLYLENLQKLKKACVLEAYSRNETIYQQLQDYYTIQSIKNFQSTPEFSKFEYLRCQDENQLISYVQSIIQQEQKNIILNNDLTLLALKSFPEIFELFENLDEQQCKIERKQTLIVYWYIYEVNRLLNSLSIFNLQSASFEKNQNKFYQYYELIDHHLTLDQLKGQLLEALNFLNIPYIINID